MTYPSGGREPGTEGEFHDELLREQAQGEAAAASPEDRTAAHWLRAIDQLDGDIRVSTRRSRAARKASGWFVFGASAFSAVALAAQMVSDWLDLPASVMDVLFGALGVGLVLSLPGLMLWTLLHDLNVRSVRRAGWRLTEPGSPGGEAMVALYRHWWDRMEENRNPRWGFGGRAELVDPRDPEWSADRIMRQSKAVPGVLCQAWEENPRRSWLVGAALGGLVGLGVLLSGLEDGAVARSVLGGTCMGAGALFWIFTSRNKGSERRDPRIFARRLERMRGDHAYASFVRRR